MTEMRTLLAMLLLSQPALAADPLRFWNLTDDTVTSLRMAPAGTDEFGPNQCTNDRDGEVDYNERLRLTGIKPGKYDVRLTLKKGRTCLVRGVDVKPGGKYAFSLEPSDLKDCR